MGSPKNDADIRFANMTFGFSICLDSTSGCFDMHARNFLIFQDTASQSVNEMFEI